MSYAVLPTLRTPRLTLRPLKENDADAIFAEVSNYDVIRWLGRIPYPYEHSDAVEFIDRVSAKGLLVWGIENADGFVGVAGIDEELGYWLTRAAWGRGYAFEAARAVVEHWFSNPNNRDLESGHYNDNDRSSRVLQALGFEKCGEAPRFARALSQEVMGTDVVLSREAWAVRQAFNVVTPNLVLRPLAECDVSLIVDLARPEVTRMLFSLKTGISEDEAQRFVARRTWRGLPGFALAIERYDKAVGFVATGASDAVEVYYALHPDYWGQSVMTEALRAFLVELFDRFPVNKLVADRFEDNPASGRVLEKCGFLETGRAVGHSAGRLEPAPVITYALTRDRLRATR